MTTKPKATTKLSLVQPDLEQMEAVVAEAASQTAPIVTRAASLANRQAVEVAALLRERADFEDRRSLLRAQFDAADAALFSHVTDIDAALALYPQQAAE